MRVLILEDNIIFQMKLRKAVTSLGFEVITGDSIEQARVYFEAERFDLLICDIVLRDGEFFDIDTVLDTPTIFITAHENLNYMEKALRINNSYFLVKPFSDLSLVAAVRYVTDKKVNFKNVITVFGKHKNPIDLVVNDIEVVESQGNYSAIYTIFNEKHIIKRSAYKTIQQGIGDFFVQVRRSTYVNKSKITRVSFSENKIYTPNNELTISNFFRKNIYEFHRLDN